MMTATATPELKRHWEMIRAAAENVVADNAATLQAFRLKVSTLFRAMLKEPQGPFKRCPHVSLKLICEGKPPAKLIVHPTWYRHNNTVNLSLVQCELFQECLRPVNGVQARKFDRQLELRLDPTDSVGLPMISGTAHQNISRAIAVMREFLEDHCIVFARSHDNCCCCGKGLTDELSRSRGIGPECIKKLDWCAFGQQEWNQLVAPDAIEAQQKPPPVPVEADEEPFVLTS
jgi:hypothetical protein